MLIKKTCRGERGGLPSPFFENRKKCPDFWKKGPDCVYLWVKFSIQNVVLRVSRRKNSKMFPCGASFSGVFDEIFIEVPKFHKSPPPLPWKISGCAPAPKHYSFCKTLHLKCLTVFWICLCLDNCSVICTVTLCYALHQSFRILAYSALFLWCMPAYLIIFRHIHAYSDIIKAHLGLFKHILHPL